MTSLVLRKRPNFGDKRVRARVEKALAWVSDELSERYARPLPKQTLEQIFGPVGNRVGDYLRANLLVREDKYIPGKQFFKYRLKQGGCEKVAGYAAASNCSIVNTSDPMLMAERRAEKHSGELETLTFTYKDKSRRLWHPLQTIKKSTKPVFWAKHGLPFDYDIEACAPTLLLQTARKAGMLALLQGPIQDYLDGRDKYRRKVMELTGLPHDDSKNLVTSLFNGARLTANSYSAAFRHMTDSGMSPGQAASAMKRLQEDKDIRALRRSICTAWRRLRLKLKREFRTGQQKWQLYFILERKVLDAIKAELERQGRKYFTEHDGFRTDASVDVAALINHVNAATGYEVRINALPSPIALL
jgi:hypothetical protein